MRIGRTAGPGVTAVTDRPLGRLSQRKRSVAELRLFIGLSVEETSAMLGVSPRTVKDDWRFSRAWLASRVQKPPRRRP